MMMLALGLAAFAAPPACTDTPDWNNRCADKGCSPGQFPFGNQTGYFSRTPAPGGWTCKMYKHEPGVPKAPKWCHNGVLVDKAAGGEGFNYPEHNCCDCGKGKVQPPAPPAPPPPPSPPPPPMIGGGALCGGACSDGMVLDRANATVWGVGAKPGTKITATLGAASASATWTAVVGSDGGWALSLGAQPPGTGHTLSLTGSDSTSVALTDIAFGDVILCSGDDSPRFFDDCSDSL